MVEPSRTYTPPLADIARMRPERAIERPIGPYKIATRVDKGLSRERNEDRVSASTVKVKQSGKPEFTESLMVVADGMGGHSNGDVAAELAIQTIEARYQALRNANVSDERALKQAIFEADSAIQAYNTQHNTNSGATLAVAVLGSGGRVVLGHVGDARGYRITEHGAYQLGTDHSIVANMVARNEIKPEDIYAHPKNNLVTRSLGNMTSMDDVEIQTSRLRAGESVLLCSDGLWEMTRDADGSVIHGLVRRSSSVTKAVDNLVETANTNGGKDNIGVAVARFEPQPLEAAKRQQLERQWVGNPLRIMRDHTVESGWIATGVTEEGEVILAKSERGEALKKRRAPEELREYNYLKGDSVGVLRSNRNYDTEGWKVQSYNSDNQTVTLEFTTGDTKTYSLSEFYRIDDFVRGLRVNDLWESPDRSLWHFGGIMYGKFALQRGNEVKMVTLNDLMQYTRQAEGQR